MHSMKENMTEQLMRENFTKIVIPKGELLGDVLRFLTAAGCEPAPVGKSELVFKFPFLALPALLVAARARDVGKIVNQPDSEFAFGLTGSDVVAEQSLTVLDQLPPEVQPTPGRVVLGFTPNMMEKVAKPRSESLSRLPKANLVTPYPNLTRAWLGQRRITAEVVELQGATESYWWGDANNMGVVDVVVSGSTFRAEKITEAETLLAPVLVNLITNADDTRLNPEKQARKERDAQVVEDLMKRLRTRRNGKRRSV